MIPTPRRGELPVLPPRTPDEAILAWSPPTDGAREPLDAILARVLDGSNHRVWTLDRETLSVLGWTNTYFLAEGDEEQALKANSKLPAAIIEKIFVVIFASETLSNVMPK